MSAINWFEIPVLDMDRAVRFYSAVLDKPMEAMDMNGTPMAFLPMEGQEGVGGALFKAEGQMPSQDGTVVYLNGGEDLAPILGRVEGAGGKTLMPKTSIGEHGFIGMFLDTEGNKVGLHSMG